MDGSALTPMIHANNDSAGLQSCIPVSAENLEVRL